MRCAVDDPADLTRAKHMSRVGLLEPTIIEKGKTILANSSKPTSSTVLSQSFFLTNRTLYFLQNAISSGYRHATRKLSTFEESIFNPSSAHLSTRYLSAWNAPGIGL